ncbi:DUF4158 domain-containing protein [Nocardia sp. NPDC050799]|uniref:DUF4158 domain-containing protein n=1 Tax=Nocardia sp. NPDC050799 TaxID=3154842 RepID=UPI0033F64495
MQLEWSPEDLIGSWTLIGKNDWRLVGNKSGATRLGFVLLLKFFEIEARFPRAAAEVPPAVVSYVAEQVKVDPALFASYRWSGRTIEYHRAQVRAAFGFREFAVSDEDQLIGWLAEGMCPVELREDRLREAVLVRCRAEKLEPPTPCRIDRLVGSARSTFDQRFCARTMSRLSAASVQALNELVTETAAGCAPCRSRSDRWGVVSAGVPGQAAGRDG